MTTEQYAIEGLKNILYIDLSSHSYHVKERRDLYGKYLGGVGVATNLMFFQVAHSSSDCSTMPVL